MRVHELKNDLLRHFLATLAYRGRKAIVGAPVDALVDLAVEVKADLLVVGNVGLSTIAGRLLGSVPANVARRSRTDVLIVHTTP